MGDDPLYPPNTTADGQTFRDWIDLVDRVARPLVEAEHEEAEQAAMVLYRKASPYFICVALLMAYNRAHPEPTRFDYADEATWPPDAEEVLTFYGGGWGVAQMFRSVRPLRWFAPTETAGAMAETGDLWLPLPPTLEVQG